MGDKYETGREMIQLELNQLNTQLAKAMSQKKELSRISLTKKYDKVAFGSLVETSQGTYFISIGLGKVGDVFVISLASPVGKLMMNKTEGDSFEINAKKVAILKIS